MVLAETCVIGRAGIYRRITEANSSEIHEEISELSDKQVYVQIEYLSLVYNKGNFEKVPGHNFFKLSLMICTSL